MRTTVNIPDGVLESLMQATGAKKKSKVMRDAIEVYLRRTKLAALKALSGKIRVCPDWEKAEKLEELENMRCRTY